MNMKESPNSLALHDDFSEEVRLASGKRKYISIDYNMRKELLKIVNNENVTIKTAAERLHINYSNAKNIVKIYKNEHRIEKLPKKPNLTIKEITAPFYNQDNIPIRAALLPFYDSVEAQQFLTWTKEKQRRSGTCLKKPIVYSNSSTRSLINSCPTSEVEGKEAMPHFSFDMYKPSIHSRSCCCDHCSYIKRLSLIGLDTKKRIQEIDPDLTIPVPFQARAVNG